LPNGVVGIVEFGFLCATSLVAVEFGPEIVNVE
jgi:hypothetical protein